MSNLICKAIHYVRSTHKVYFLQIHLFSASSSSSLKSIKKSSSQPSFAVAYLINSCGLSPERALIASKYVKFEVPDKPDAVLAFFKRHGFTQTQISALVRKLPVVLACDPEKTLLPKLEFLKSKGVSSTDIAKILCLTPNFLKASLENQIIPSFNFVSNLLQSELNAVVAVKRFGGLVLLDPQTYVVPNIEILLEAGVPSIHIVRLFKYQPRTFVVNSHRFRQTVEEVQRLGFNPSRMKFLFAVHALRSMSKPTWEKKLEIYKRWGWSEDVILESFRKHPFCMMVSEDKLMGVMDFYVNKMGWESSMLANRPIILSLSLQKRIVPRCTVYQALLLKGLVKVNKISLSQLLEIPQQRFIEKFVNSHEKEAPELLKLYKEKLNLAKYPGDEG